MLCLTRKTDYSLIALGYLAERPGRVISAKEMAEAYDLPQALLMNILKTLQKKRIINSTRGIRGGYALSSDLTKVSLYDLIHALEGKVEPGCDHEEDGSPAVNRRGSAQGPLQALHYKLMRFLHDVRLADLVFPGRRIDVPAENLGKKRKPGISRIPGSEVPGVIESLVPVEI